MESNQIPSVNTANHAMQQASFLVAKSALSVDGQEEAQQIVPRRQRDVCRHWARGYCNRGTMCGFYHTGPSPNPELCRKNSEEVEDGYAATKSSVPCKDFQVGKCNRGEKCKFVHTECHLPRPRYPFTDKAHVQDPYMMQQHLAYNGYELAAAGGQVQPPPQYYNEIPQQYVIPNQQVPINIPMQPGKPHSYEAMIPVQPRYPTVVQHCPYG
eukprot:TRINITY_DN5681_c0_g3_i1.p1 TRINITY_DN5681_c0_g3~~TRINITY_DN5681_c0_g3_i1.p1  ORF type:complete len:219 (+),score=50.53 TRINITY_DN5681_c0_g3_i1:23-658(+)